MMLEQILLAFSVKTNLKPTPAVSGSSLHVTLHF